MFKESDIAFEKQNTKSEDIFTKCKIFVLFTCVPFYEINILLITISEFSGNYEIGAQ